MKFSPEIKYSDPVFRITPHESVDERSFIKLFTKNRVICNFANRMGKIRIMKLNKYVLSQRILVLLTNDVYFIDLYISKENLSTLDVRFYKKQCVVVVVFYVFRLPLTISSTSTFWGFFPNIYVSGTLLVMAISSFIFRNVIYPITSINQNIIVKAISVVFWY